ncbi:MAG: succinate dehydrogenase iron-sulfur subunit [Actinobacteria bacterium]|nr:succinate dehydrogenase iron-sulfur subunit [Actinomycetota bacterium]
MRVALKVWRSGAGVDRSLREYEVDAPDSATLLDVLELIKDRVDGTLAYRRSCRMMICGSCGMRLDGAAVLACKVRMHDIAASGHVPVVSPMGNLPVVKDLVVDMAPFWAKYRAVNPYLQTANGTPAKEHVVSQESMEVIGKESLCINCGCCVSECNAMESSPEFLGPQALAKAMRFVGDPRDGAQRARLEGVNGEHGIWECTRCYFCNERCPKGVDPRDAIAKLGAQSVAQGIDRDLGAKHAKWFVTSARTTGWLRETELVPRTQGVVAAIRETRFALGLARHGKVLPPFPPHVAKRVRESELLHELVSLQGREGYAGIVQGERGLARHAVGLHEGARDPYGPGSFPRPWVAEDEQPEAAA